MRNSVVVIGTRGYPSYYGGFETAVRKLAPYLAEEGWEVNVYCRPGATKDDDEGRDYRVRTTQTKGIDKKSLSTLSYGLSAVLHTILQKPDVALIMNVANGFWLPLLKLRGVPTVVNVDGLEWERGKWGVLAKTFFKLGARFTARFADFLISDSLEIQRRWREDFNRESEFIPYGGDVPTNQDVVSGLSHGSYVLMVARFVPENTVAEFFEAVKLIADDYPIVIIGSCGYGGDLDDAARMLDEHYPDVTWLGHVSDDRKLSSLWQHAGVYFHGHSVGGTNPALVQAMACGAPVVARQTPYNREVLLDGAYLVPPEPVAIAKAMRLMLSDPNLQAITGAKNRERAVRYYNWPDVCSNYQQNLHRAIKSSRKPVAPTLRRNPA
ncbi:MAG: glycosyl transferase [Pseudarthrobacter sp.]|nr:glycosyl transferase [Pseudarthrobacter sp.]